MIRVGIIGFGKMRQIRLEALKGNPKATVVGVTDPDAADPIPLDLVVPSAEALIRSPKINAVFICVPNYLNNPLTLQALSAGKHVFCEKPPAFTAKDVEEI